MAAEIVHHQMDCLCIRVLKDQFGDDLRELNTRSIRRGEGEMPARLRLYGAENVSRTASFILVIPPGFPSRLRRRRRANIGVERDGLLI